MKQEQLEKIIEILMVDQPSELELSGYQLTTFPSRSIGNFTNLTTLSLAFNQLNNLPEDIGKLTNLNTLELNNNELKILPDSIGSLTNLTTLSLAFNQLNNLPESMGNLTNLFTLYLDDNPLADLSILQNLPNLSIVTFFNIELPRRYWTKLSAWKSQWLLDEDNAEIKRRLIEQIGYEKICEELNAVAIDTWREYTLLKIDGVEKIYSNGGWKPVDTESMVLLKMICPSTMHIHILRVPPEMMSAEEAITWVNHGIHPDEFFIQT